MVFKIAFIPTIFVLGMGAYFLHVNDWLIYCVGGVIGIIVIGTDTFLERRKRNREGVEGKMKAYSPGRRSWLDHFS
jgi:hypothetical protein